MRQSSLLVRDSLREVDSMQFDVGKLFGQICDWDFEFSGHNVVGQIACQHRRK